MTPSAAIPAGPAQPFAAPAMPTRRSRTAGRVLSGVGVAFLLFDAAIKVLQAPQAIEGTVQLGWPAHLLFGIGVLQLVLLVVYLVPRTAILGAILWTGYLGGAVATHVRLENPLFSHVLFPTYVAALLWAGLWLRDARAQAILRRATV
ncbi:MAG TPA: DoxX family protein [Anaeromyxobacteraceae bacterium]|nr:DoxX family protein [Anaeromyxobacteraceae bacterium]